MTVDALAMFLEAHRLVISVLMKIKKEAKE